MGGEKFKIGIEGRGRQKCKVEEIVSNWYETIGKPLAFDELRLLAHGLIKAFMTTTYHIFIDHSNGIDRPYHVLLIKCATFDFFPISAWRTQ